MEITLSTHELELDCFLKIKTETVEQKQVELPSPETQSFALICILPCTV